MSRLRVPVFLRHSGWNAATQVLPAIVFVVLTPYTLSKLGPDRFGVWSIVASVAIFLTTLDGGIVAATQRSVTLRIASQDWPGVTRLMTSVALAICGLGLLTYLASLAAISAVLPHLNIPAAQRPEANAALHLVGIVVACSLLSVLPNSILQAEQRFRAIAWITAVRVSTQCLLMVLSLASQKGVVALILSTCVSQLLATIVGLTLIRHCFDIRRPFLISGAELREFSSFASRMQVTNITVLINVELDVLVIAAIAPIRVVGMYSIASNVASVMRTLPLSALPPMFTRFTRTFALEGQGPALARFRSYQTAWLTFITGYVLVGVAAVPFGIQAWLGPSGSETRWLAAIVFLGFGVNLITGAASVFCRATGHPGLETRYALVCTGVNVVLTVPMGLLLGAYGVVLATAIGSGLGSAYFYRILKNEFAGEIPGLWRSISIRSILSAIVSVGIVVLIEWITVRHVTPGAWGLVVSGIPAAVALGVYAALTWKRLQAV